MARIVKQPGDGDVVVRLRNELVEARRLMTAALDGWPSSEGQVRQAWNSVSDACELAEVLMNRERVRESAAEEWERSMRLSIEVDTSQLDAAMEKLKQADELAGRVQDKVRAGVLEGTAWLPDAQLSLLKAAYRHWGMKWLAMDKNGRAFFYGGRPVKSSHCWSATGGGCLCAMDLKTRIDHLVSWEDAKPLNIVQVLRDNGVEVGHDDE